MCKKLISTILCMVMLLSVVGVSAATKDETTNGIARKTWTDDFNHSITEAVTGGYPTATYTSDIFVNENNEYCTAAALTPAAGTNGSVGLVVTGPSTKRLRYLRTKAMDIGTGNNESTLWYELSFDLKITEADGLYIGSTSQNRHLFYLNGGNISVASDGYGVAWADSGKDYTPDAWYHVVILVNGDRFTGWIYDNNGLCIESYMDTGKSSTFIDAVIMLKNGYTSNNVTVDNAKLVEYVRDSVAPSLVSVPSIADNTAVSTDIESITVKMDQPIDVASSIAKLGDNNLVITEATTAPYTYILTGLPALASGTSYTLDLSGLKNLSGVDAGESAKYTFTTETGIVLPKVVTSVPANGDTGISRTIGTMSVTFNEAVTEAPSTVTLTSSASNITASVSEPVGNTYTFTWSGKLANNTTYTVDLSGFGDGTNAVTESLSFTTENNSIIPITDDFEGVDSIKTNGYNVEGAAASPLMTAGKGRWNGNVDSEVNGYTNKALKLMTGESYEGIGPVKTVATYTPASYTDTVTGETEYEQFIMTYRIKLGSVSYETFGHKTADNYTDDGLRIRLGAVGVQDTYDRDNSLAIITSDAAKTYINANISDDSVKKELEVGHWYNIVYAINGTEQTFTLIDAEGSNQGSVVLSYKKEYVNENVPHFSTSDALKFYLIDLQRQVPGGTQNVYNNKLTVLLDDFTLWCVKPWEEDHALAVNSVDEENFIMTFNQPVLGTKDMLKVSLNNSENDNIAFDAGFIYPDFCSQKITVTGVPKSSNLVLDYSGLQGVSGSGILETERPTSLIEFTSDSNAEYALAFAGQAAYNEGTVSFNLYGATAQTPSVYVAYYSEGNLVGVKVPETSVSITAGNKATVSVSAPEAFDAIRVFAWNDGLQPLMRRHNQTLVVQPEVPAE